uniref:AAA+ ATPase domain-containing protein n=1 Tax=Fagus sylvatica TaxID=28930 RepID=A0A2N9GLD7_FAGSY
MASLIRVGYREATQAVGIATFNKGYEAFESRRTALTAILEALKDPNINKIGVYGTGGMGKTMLVKEVVAQAQKDKLFDKYPFVVVSQDPKLEKIQREIADQLDLNLDVESEPVKADLLRKRLQQEKILIVIDDIWKSLDLEALGFPFGNDKTGCKILLTSRFHNVLRNVKMHDVIRDVAINIAVEDKHMFTIRSAIDLEDLSKWNNSTAISLPGIDIDVCELPERLECSKLQLFLLFNQKDSFKIPDSFFGGLKELRVLKIPEISPAILPSSLLSLEKLQTLCLDGQVKDVTIIGELKNLKVLTLSLSNLEQLPKEIGQLSHIQLLDLKKCYKLKVIPPNVLSNLKKLEELYMPSSVQWETEVQSTNGSNAMVSELDHLSQLTTLDIFIQNPKILPKALIFKNLKRICNNQLPAESFRKLKVVNVYNCNKLEFVFSSSMVGSFSQLQEMKISSCQVMSAIVSVLKEGKGEIEVNDDSTIVFAKLRSLTLTASYASSIIINHNPSGFFFPIICKEVM